MKIYKVTAFFIQGMAELINGRDGGILLMGIDFGILDFIQTNLRCGILDVAMPLVTKLGDGGIFWICCALILLAVPKTREIGVIMAVSLVLEAFCCNVILKPLVARIRPYEVNTGVQLLIPPPGDFSFPSGHTSASFASAAALFFGRSRFGIPAFVLAVFIAFSRLYLYVHYPTDVLAGALIGIISALVGNIIVKAFEKKRTFTKIKEKND